jgi:hypothetical protein
MKLPLHDNVLVGRDLDQIFDPGKVYAIQEFGGEFVITCLGESALPINGIDPERGGYPNQHSQIGEIMQDSRYMMTLDEYYAIEKQRRIESGYDD